MAFELGLALGGGAARGLAHLGVLRVLEQAGIRPKVIAGTSVGSIIGAIYASHAVIEDAISEIQSYLKSSYFNQTRLSLIKEADREQETGYYALVKRFLQTSYFFAISTTQAGFITEDTLRTNLEHILPKIRLEDCEIPFGVTLANLATGKIHYVTQGDLIDHVLASSSIPGIFPPVKLGRDFFIDGSWVEPIPVDLARKMGATFVLAVDVAPNIAKDDADHTGFNINLRANEATRLALKEQNLKTADFVVRVNLPDQHWADFMQIDECVAAGEAAMREKLPHLKQVLRARRLRSALWPWF